MSITQRIAALNGGVSQRPQSQRISGQAEAQTNAYNHPLRGLLKRPPTEHFSKLSTDVAGLDTGFVHHIDLSPTERFLALIRNGALSVFDKGTGGQVEVNVIGADNYVTTQPETQIDVLDSFTDADGVRVAQHKPNIGSRWTLVEGTDPIAEVISNRLIRIFGGTNFADYRLQDYAAPVNDYMVTANFSIDIGWAPSSLISLYIRAGANDLSGYSVDVKFLNPNFSVVLSRWSTTGVQTIIGAQTPTGILCVTPTDFSIRATGNLIEVLANGVVILSATDATYPTQRGVRMAWSGTSLLANEHRFDNLRIQYTAPAVSGPAPFRAVQVGKQTVFTNSTVTVARGTTSSPNKKYQALVAIRQADYGTQYKLTINNQVIAFGSPEGIVPQSRNEIDTTSMAAKLMDLILSANVLAEFFVTRYGSTLLLERNDGGDFTITADDGLADNGLVVVKGSVQSFADLPAKGPNGFIVEVTGDATNQFDNYFVRFDVTNTATSAGVWKECVKPGEVISLNPATMPHVLTYKGSFVGTSLADSVSAGTPPLPTIVPSGGSLIYEDWDAMAVGGRGIMQNHGDHYNAVMDAANGISTEYTIFFDVDTRNADKSNLATVYFQKETGAIGSDVWADVATYLCAPETLLSNQSLSAQFVRNAGERIRIGIRYANAVTPTDKQRAQIYTAVRNVIFIAGGGGYTKPTSTKPIEYIKHTGRAVTFDATRKFPQGALIRITCDGNNFDYTPATDVTGATVATTLKGTIDAHATYVATNPSTGVILVTRVDNADPVISCTITWNPATSFHDPNLAMVVNGLTGKTVRNLTDNSTATVLSNTATTITVAVMTGGADNTFQTGDKVEVTQITGSKYFTFGPATWAQRETGDLTSNPMPSFVDQKINDVLITKGRLGFVSGGNIVLSEVGNLFNVFRTTVTQLLDGDPIDVKPAHGEAVRFHSYSAWDGRDIFWSSRHQFELSGEPLLSPKTVKLLPISEYPMDAIRPVTLGRYAYFVTKRAGFAQVWAYAVGDGSLKPEAVRLTADVGQYLAGSVLAIAGDEDMGAFFVLTDADRSKLFVQTFDRNQKLYTWSQWQFPAGTTIVGMSILDGVLTVMSKRSDAAYLDTVDLDYLGTFDLLDRKVSFASGSGVFAGGNTDWTLPYSCATNGSEGTLVVLNAATGAIIASTRPTATSVRAVGNFSATAVIVGISYTFSHTFSTIFQRTGQEQLPLLAGRLQLSRLRINYEDTRGFTVTVTPLGRTARSISVDVGVDTDGTLMVPVQCKNTDVSIVISNNQPTACRITDVQWEGNHYFRAKSV